MPTTEHTKINVEEINTHNVDVSIEVKETIQYTTEVVRVQVPDIVKDKNIDDEHISEYNKEKTRSDTNNTDEDIPSTDSSSIASSHEKGDNVRPDTIKKKEDRIFDFPSKESVYENLGDESKNIPLYVDTTDNFDSDLRDYYLDKHSDSEKVESSLQEQIQDNSNNFMKYLRKYGDGHGSTGSTDSPVPYSLKSSNEDEEEDISSWRRNSELIEKQIVQDINEIDRALELMGLEYDIPNQFIFDGRDVKEASVESTTQTENISDVKESIQPKQRVDQKDYKGTEEQDSVDLEIDTSYSNVPSFTPPINNRLQNMYNVDVYDINFN